MQQFGRAVEDLFCPQLSGLLPCLLLTVVLALAAVELGMPIAESVA